MGTQIRPTNNDVYRQQGTGGEKTALGFKKMNIQLIGNIGID